MDIDKSINFQVYREGALLGISAIIKESFPFERTLKYEILPDSFKSLGDIIHSEYNGMSKTTILYTKLLGGLVYINNYRNTLSLEIYAASIAEIDTIETYIREQIPEAPEVIAEQIRVKFWYLTAAGASNVSRVIQVPTWEQIKYNYSESTRDGLDDLINNFTPSAGGKIILWHGLPGTGKTYALRALTRKWKSWASAEYILDPEALFGHSAGYLSQMIFDGSSTELISPEDEEEEKSIEHKWKLLILEDTGELLAEDAKSRTGQGLSRLLNLADGFIGQGLRVLILITTNEELDRLHPAVSRQGRCAAAIHFSELSRNDAQEWAAKHNVILPPDRRTTWTLADLYALESVAKIEVVPKKESTLGFKAVS